MSKAIDKRGGNADMAGEIARAIRDARVKRGLSVGECDRRFCGGTTNWTWFEGRKGECRPPTPETFARIVAEWPELSALADAVAEVERDVVGTSEELYGRKSGIGNAVEGHYTVGGTKAEAYDVTAPATAEAERWQGWGTALKPSHEPVVVARKPLQGTVAANVLAHGTGALNVDGCRIEGTGNVTRARDTGSRSREQYRTGTVVGAASPTDLGRWPANVLLSHADGCVRVGERKVRSGTAGPRSGGIGAAVVYSPSRSNEDGMGYEHGFAETDGTETVEAWECVEGCPVAELDAQSGERMHGAGVAREAIREADATGMWGLPGDGQRYGDTGGASRFFLTTQRYPGEGHEHELLTGDADTLCVLCGLPCAESAEASSSLLGEASASARASAPAPPPPDSEDNSLSPDGPANPAAGSSSTTRRTGSESSAPPTAPQELGDWIVRRARSAVSLCDSCGIATAQSTARTLLGHDPESQAGPASTLVLRRRTLSRSLALIAAGAASTGTIPTTSDLRALCGSAAAVTTGDTPASGTGDVTVPMPRLFYQAKASRAERNAGLDGFDETDGAAIRPKSRRCNVCGSSAKEAGANGRYPSCEHDDWDYVEADGGRHKGALRNAHPT